MPILTLLIITGALVITPEGIGASANDQSSKTYVLLLNPECDWEFRDRFDYYMHMNNTEYEHYLDSYRVICLGGVKNLTDVENYILPNLRLDLPNDKFIFVYPDSMVDQFHDYIEGKYGSQYRYLALGSTDIPNGVAYAGEVPANVKHEMAHLATCGTWHDEQGEDLGHLVRHPQADLVPWCSH
jgi:hypothetical protein